MKKIIASIILPINIKKDSLKGLWPEAPNVRTPYGGIMIINESRGNIRLIVILGITK